MTLVTPPSGPDFDVTDERALSYYRHEPGYVVHDGVSGPASNAPIVPAWAASTSYSAGQVVQHPSSPDLFLRRIAAGVSRSSFDATELATWKAFGAATYAPINPANWTQGNGTYVSLTGPNTITNPAGATDSALQIEQFATGAGDGQTYGLEVHRFDTTRSAVVIHDYANNSSEPSLWIDNTGAGPMLKLHNTQNLTTNPGHDGTGDFFIFADHDLTFCHTDKDFIWRFDNASRAKTFTVLNTAATPFSVQSTFNGTGLDVQKAGTGAGTAVRIANSGTGLAIDVRSATTSLWAVTAAGLPQWVAAGNQQTTVGAAGGASALPATPTKYVKIVDSAGTTLVVPAYAAS